MLLFCGVEIAITGNSRRRSMAIAPNDVYWLRLITILLAQSTQSMRRHRGTDLNRKQYLIWTNTLQQIQGKYLDAATRWFPTKWTWTTRKSTSIFPPKILLILFSHVFSIFERFVIGDVNGMIGCSIWCLIPPIFSIRVNAMHAAWCNPTSNTSQHMNNSSPLKTLNIIDALSRKIASTTVPKKNPKTKNYLTINIPLRSSGFGRVVLWIPTHEWENESERNRHLNLIHLFWRPWTMTENH